jgi:hypothetical protein
MITAKGFNLSAIIILPIFEMTKVHYPSYIWGIYEQQIFMDIWGRIFSAICLDGTLERFSVSHQKNES